MTEETWERQAERLAAAWPTPPMDPARRAVYFEVLRDLDDEAVESAVSALLGEDRSEMPPPGAIKTRGAALGGGDGTEGPDPRTKGTAKIDADAREREGRRPWLGVLFGILGIFPIALWLGIWSLRDRNRARAEGRKYEGFAAAVTAIVLGCVSALLLAVALVIFLADSSPNDGEYLTRSELETSIVN